MFTVTIPKECQLWQACATGKARPVLQTIQVSLKARSAVAVDGFILAVVSCKVEGSDERETVLLPAAVVKEAKGGPIYVEQSECYTKETHYPLPASTFPNFRSLIPKEVRAAPTEQASFSAEYIVRLAKAIGARTNGGVLSSSLWETAGARSPYVAMSNYGVGVIMPMFLQPDTTDVNQRLSLLREQGD